MEKELVIAEFEIMSWHLPGGIEEVCVCVCVCVHACMHAHTHTHIYIYTYIHTYIHI